jgi:hypothetical protein
MAGSAIWNITLERDVFRLGKVEDRSIVAKPSE